MRRAVIRVAKVRVRVYLKDRQVLVTLGVCLNHWRAHRMLAADHADELSRRDEFARAREQAFHHRFGRRGGRRHLGRVYAEAIDFRVGLLVVEFHVARGVNDCQRARARSRPIRDRALVRDGPHHYARALERRQRLVLYTAEVHR